MLVYLLFMVVTNQYEDIIYLTSAPGWASENGGVRGGGNTNPIVVTSLDEFKNLVSLPEPLNIILKRDIGEEDSLDTIFVNSNKTVIGEGKPVIRGCIYIKDVSNIILRNLVIIGPGAIDVNGIDCITVDNSKNIWLDHLDISDGQDGNLDIINSSNYITVSWCKFHYSPKSVNHKFSNLVGNSDEKLSDRGKLKVTFIYNWWAEGVESRMPRVRFGQVHVINNIFTSTGNSYCIMAGVEADLRIEHNLFINVKEPINLSNKKYKAVTVLNNEFKSVFGNTLGEGESFKPPYKVKIIPLHKLEEVIKVHAGATIPREILRSLIFSKSTM